MKELNKYLGAAITYKNSISPNRNNVIIDYDYNFDWKYWFFRVINLESLKIHHRKVRTFSKKYKIVDYVPQDKLESLKILYVQ